MSAFKRILIFENCTLSSKVAFPSIAASVANPDRNSVELNVDNYGDSWTSS